MKDSTKTYYELTQYMEEHIDSHYKRDEEDNWNIYIDIEGFTVNISYMESEYHIRAMNTPLGPIMYTLDDDPYAYEFTRLIYDYSIDKLEGDDNE